MRTANIMRTPKTAISLSLNAAASLPDSASTALLARAAASISLFVSFACRWNFVAESNGCNCSANDRGSVIDFMKCFLRTAFYLELALHEDQIAQNTASILALQTGTNVIGTATQTALDLKLDKTAAPT
ncbi:hypothetical protein B484DRAFT_400783 [Ochromonadaceae sp. CCMP2298]|nr:hypothetical protein B484DRAFT_400783 [Ochromonadaceae sp. CCMP2298]